MPKYMLKRGQKTNAYVGFIDEERNGRTIRIRK